MTNVLAILGALGGLATFLTAAGMVIRAAAKQVSATSSNTDALKGLQGAVEQLDERLTKQGEEIAWLKGRVP